MQLVVTLPDGKRFVFTSPGFMSRKAQEDIMRRLIEDKRGEPSQR